MASKKKSAREAMEKKPKAKRSAKEVPVENEGPYYDETELSYVLSDAENLILEYEDLDEEEVTEEVTDELISEMDCVRDRLEDFADDGWEDYRDTIEEYSNRLWNLGVAWPQFLPPWHTADTVDPEDICDPIKDAWIYEEDFYAIRAMSDKEKMSFKAMVHELVNLGKKKYKHSR